jgi:hypothetical protein
MLVDMTRRRRALLAALPALVLIAVACQPEDANRILRSDVPIVLEGADLPDLLGAAPGDIVAFRHVRVEDVPTWQQVPVQVDERAMVDFGTNPSGGQVGGVTNGTIYGNTPRGLSALQYTDPSTFVGADPDATFDADDELAFMLRDAGGSPRADDPPIGNPPGVVAGSGVLVNLTDPLTGKLGWLYLFESASLDPAAGADYVDYDFNLTSGPYKTTYRVDDGPNPETSTVFTDNYEIRYPDRWMDSDWRITAGSASGVDVLDGLKFRFGWTTCGRSNATFIDEEGAFVANIDGPVRAIRSYVGANSGPYTQRTHLFYRARHDIVTDLRVHAIPATYEHYDFSSAAIGMEYRSSEQTSPIVIDGVPDAVSSTIPTWEVVTGGQGTLLMTSTVETSIPGDRNAMSDQFFRDELNSPVQKCWGDDNHFLGATGENSTLAGGVPNTDPAIEAPPALDTFKAIRTIQFDAPIPAGLDPSAFGAAWGAQTAAPVTATASPFVP